MKKKRKLPIILFFLSIVMLAAGLAIGEYNNVLEQAITVCLSCIGIG